MLNWVRAERVRDVWEARPHPPRTTRARPGWAIAGAGAVFLIAYGLQAVSAFMLYLSPAASADRASESTTMIHDAIGGQLALLFVAAVVAEGIVLVTMPRGLRLRDYQRKIPGQRGGAALTAASVMVTSLVGAVLAWVVGIASMNTALPAGETLRQGIGQAVLAGIGEEIFVLVLPYTALRLVRLPARDGVRRGLPLTVVVAVCVALRMSYHVYYGPGIVSLLPWAVLTVLVFHRWRLLTPLVLTHIAYDSVLSVAESRADHHHRGAHSAVRGRGGSARGRCDAGELSEHCQSRRQRCGRRADRAAVTELAPGVRPADGESAVQLRD